MLSSYGSKFFQAVARQNALIPERTLVGCIRATLACQVAAGKNRIVADRFHAVVSKLNGLLRSVRYPKDMQCILEAHEAKSHRTMAQIRIACLAHAVVVDVDHVVEHAHGSTARARKA